MHPNCLEDILSKATSLAIPITHLWVDGGSFFFHFLRMICLAIMAHVWIQLVMYLSCSVKIESSPKTNNLGLYGIIVSVILLKFYVFLPRIFWIFLQTIRRAWARCPPPWLQHQQLGDSVNPRQNNLKGVQE